MSLPVKTSAEDFAKYIAENKPYLIEVEEAVQKMGNYGEIEAHIFIRNGSVEKVTFWSGNTWLRQRIDAIERK